MTLITVDGLGEFENITHAEAKNAVGSAIEIADGFDANIWKQGKKILVKYKSN